MKTTICTLFEDHYHYGVASLINSLSFSGYEGTVWVGYRGSLPPWIARRLEIRPGGKYRQVTPSLQICMVELDPPTSLNYYKPTFLLNVMRKFDPAIEAITYMDPDLIVKCRWQAIEQWMKPDGIALIEDAKWLFPSTHPKRVQWRKFFSPHGLMPVRKLDRFYNAGFIGISRQQIDLLISWQKTCEIVAAHNGGSDRRRRVGESDRIFRSADEDALNFALSTCTTRLDTRGPEDLDMAPGGNFLSHAVGSFKPWQGQHIRRALRGEPPTLACRWFYRFAAGPLRPFPLAVLWKRRMAVEVALTLGRLVGRSTMKNP